MQCPQCLGEIPPASKFCGVCGNNINDADVVPPPTYGSSESSFFELTTGSRTKRLVLILGFNLILAGVGIAGILLYLGKRDAVPESTALVPNEKMSSSETFKEDLEKRGVEQDEDASKVGRRIKKQQRKNKAGQKKQVKKKRTSKRVVVVNKDVKSNKDSVSKSIDDKVNEKSTIDESSQGDTENLNDPVGKEATPEPRTETQPTDDKSVARTEEEESAHVQVVAAKIALVVKRHQTQLKRCYRSALKVTTPDTPLEGRVNIRFSMLPSGHAKSVAVQSDSIGAKPLSRCLVTLVENWEFPSFEGKALDFVWPFDFKAPK